jgi:diguanylate cyclase (GGDEF)-like protein
LISILFPDQLKELQALETAVPTMADFESACRFLVTNVARIFDAPAVLLDYRGGRWRPVAEAGGAPPHVITKALHRVAEGAAAKSLDRATDIVIDRAPWTCLSLRDPKEDQLLLLVGGDWTLSRPLLVDLAARFGAVLKPFDVVAGATTDRRVVAAYTFARRLGRATPARIHDMIAETCARAVNADRASVALYDKSERCLSISATYGYPVVLVKHLRVRSGVGVIGTVFRTGRPLRVDDVRRLPDAPRLRLRYRTPAFMSVPLLGTEGVRGVISVCDPAKSRTFDRLDLRMLRGLAGVASLALDRIRAIDEANAHARVAAIDPLTGLFNRRHFSGRLEEEIERARRQLSPLTLLLLDVDSFKELNDRLGHLAGDAVLRVVGDVLRRSVRLFDVCTRYGGDEFAILMPGSGPESTRQIAERIREGVEDSRPAGGPWADDLRVTASIGIATFAGTTAEDLIARADQALYAAKREGKNRVSFDAASQAKAL